MCRSIKPLFNLEPKATDAEIKEAAVQFVRKLSGFTKPSQRNEASFDQAINEISQTISSLFQSLHSDAQPRTREHLAEQRRIRNAKRFPH